MAVPNLFVRKSSGALCRINSVNASYVNITVLVENPMHWNMPRAEYEASFVEDYRPATAEDLLAITAEVELPANAPPEWHRNNVLTDRASGG
jgi:hypothetical protein